MWKKCVHVEYIQHIHLLWELAGKQWKRTRLVQRKEDIGDTLKRVKVTEKKNKG